MSIKNKWIKRIMIIAVALIGLLAVSVYAYLLHPKFGRKPQGERLERMQKSKHFRDGVFHNANNTPVMAEGVSYFSVVLDFAFNRTPRANPVDSIPAVHTDLKALPADQDILVWFGHSSYYIQLAGKKFLVDPVFSGAASPVSFTTKAFSGANGYSAEDMPDVDYLIITHDHWDHLDYETILKLNGKVGKVICGLGVGEYFEYWGYNPQRIIEMDWWESINLATDFSIHSVPARHFSGRTFVRNRTLWSAFVLKSSTYQIYLSGDGGYDTHFAEAAEKFGEFDLAVLENGQYNEHWKYIHSLPAEVVKEAKDLKAKRVFPGHSCKFKLALHAWSEPLDTLYALSKNEQYLLLTPQIGQPVNLRDSLYSFAPWWKSVK